MRPPVAALLHDVIPPAIGRLFIVALVLSAVGFLSVAVSWFRRKRRPTESQPRAAPPIGRIFLGSAAALLVPMLTCAGPSVGFDSVIIALWLFYTVILTGVATVFWWMRPRWEIEWLPRWDRAEVAVPVGAPPTSLRSEKDACSECRLAAKSGGPPLIRLAEKSNPPTFLYRCSRCHSYWSRDVKGARVVTPLQAREEFPGANVL